MVDLEPQVSMELQVDQENLADQEDQVCPGRRVRQVATESLDHLESKESQDFQVMVALAHLDFQGCQVRKETQVSLAHPALQVFQAPKERLVSLVLLVHPGAAAHLEHQE